MEPFEEAWQCAAQTLQRLQVTCIRAATVGVDGYLKGKALSAEERASEHYQLYHERDLKLMTAKDAPPLLLEPLCATYDFDLVLIDGNEYTGFAEYEIVVRVCQPRFLALQCTGHEMWKLH